MSNDMLRCSDNPKERHLACTSIIKKLTLVLPCWIENIESDQSFHCPRKYQDSDISGCDGKKSNNSAVELSCKAAVITPSSISY